MRYILVINVINLPAEVHSKAAQTELYHAQSNQNSFSYPRRTTAYVQCASTKPRANNLQINQLLSFKL